jgi:uncharacterized protein
MIEPISPATLEPALRYLDRDPYLNVFLTHILKHDPAPPPRKNVAVARDGNALLGVAYYGRQFAIACEPAAVEGFAERAKRHRGERMIVGPRAIVAAFWQNVARWHAAPRVVRERQLVMAVDRTTLLPYESRTLVRQARMDEWRAVADGSAAMIRLELDYDPQHDRGEFNAGIRQMIEQQLWWVGSAGGRLCFLCNLGPWSDRTIQLQGIWTPPDLRGQGLATASLAAICDHLLEVSPSLSLYVNDFNLPAIALYERVGFRHVGDFQTILF